MRRVDFSGRVFGRLTVVSRGETYGRHRTTWICRCECGTTKQVSTDSLRAGTVSCGCWRAITLGNMTRTHGESDRTKEYRAWENARKRCKPGNPASEDYYERGIRVCPEWEHDYPAFLAHMGRCPDGYTLDRINNDGNYEPGNCRWASRKVQANNRRPRRWQRRAA